MKFWFVRRTTFEEIEMLLIGLYLVFIVLVAAAAIWLYRSLFEHRGLRQNLVGRADSHIRMTLKAQQGFITLGAVGRQSTTTDSRRRERTGDLKVPWGW